MVISYAKSNMMYNSDMWDFQPTTKLTNVELKYQKYSISFSNKLISVAENRTNRCNFEKDFVLDYR